MITLFLIVLAGICNSIMDILFTRYDKSAFKNLNPLYWNPKQSWKAKWKMPLRSPAKRWYHFGFPPDHEEAFPYSSTLLVWATDGWHLAKALMLVGIVLSPVVYEPIWSIWVDPIIYYVAWTTTFTLCYTRILARV